MTLRLSDAQYEKLRQLAMRRSTSYQRLLVDLIDAEFAREGIGTTETVGSGLDRLREALGNPVITDEHREANRRMLAEARLEGERIYGTRAEEPHDGASAA